MSQTKAQLIDTLVASLLPASDSSVDIGSNAVRFANIYGDTLYGNGANLTGINTDLVSDTSPQLGGDLQSNGNDIDFADNDKAIFGTGSDFEIYHNGFTSIIASTSHTLGFYSGVNHHFLNANGTETSAKFIPNGAVELYYDNTVRFMTNSTGAQVTGTFTCSSHFNVGDNVQIQLGNAATNDFILVHDGTDNIINCGNNGNLFQRATSIHLQSLLGENKVVAETDGAVELYYDNSKKFETTSTGATLTGALTATGAIFTSGVTFTGASYNTNWVSSANTMRFYDNAKAGFGDADDIQIYHDGTYNRIAANAQIFLQNLATNESYLAAYENGQVELYYDNSKKFETTSIGATVTGNLTLSAELNLTGGSDAARFIDAAVGTNGLTIRKTTGGDSGHEYMAQFIGDGGVELYHDGTKKFETYSNGATVTGNLNASNVDLGDNGMVRFGASNDLRILHDATNSFIQNDTGNLVIAANRGGDVGGQIWIDALNGERSARFYANAQAELFYNGAKTFETINGGVEVTGQFYVTAEINLQNGTADAARFIDAGLGSHTLSIRGTSGGDTNHETLATFTRNGSAELYYDNVKKFETATDHVTITGVNNDASGISYIKFKAANGSLRASIGKESNANGQLMVNNRDNDSIVFKTSNTTRMSLTDSGHLEPETNGSQNLGQSSKRWANVYTSDLDLSNEASGGNDVDGTWGSYTIQEGAEDLFLINKRSGKKYKFNLTEVS